MKDQNVRNLSKKSENNSQNINEILLNNDIQDKILEEFEEIPNKVLEEALKKYWLISSDIGFLAILLNPRFKKLVCLNITESTEEEKNDNNKEKESKRESKNKSNDIDLDKFLIDSIFGEEESCKEENEVDEYLKLKPEYILKRLPDHNWSTLKEKQDKSHGAKKMAYSLEMFGFILALRHRLLRHAWAYIQVSNGDRDFSDLSDDSENSEADEKPLITISCSSTAANQSKLVITPQAPKEEMEIEEDQPASQLHITNVDQPKMDSSTNKKDKKKRKKKKSRQNQSQEANQVTQPILSSLSSNPPILEKSPPPQSSTQEKGKSLEKKDKQRSDIYGEDEANYIVTGFQPSPTSMAIRDILIYDILAKWSNFDILQHLSL
ncbi:hypothetical protein GLOIN_2v1765063 [Rhizophagus clarus]|uniref:Uncharacterized protein n=1 Tax=Rhizophagus clarus TaxID=94130 RepID=A0A8H3QRT6_9GLOM|nr:hypothetical protein GLOIN_2v1765063 [Rhizophagus clarus]